MIMHDKKKYLIMLWPTKTCVTITIIIIRSSDIEIEITGLTKNRRMSITTEVEITSSEKQHYMFTHQGFYLIG